VKEAIYRLGLAWIPAFAGMTLVIFTALLPARAESVVSTSGQLTFSYAPIVKKVSPAVVNIFVKRVVHERVGLSPFLNDPVFRQFFGNAPDVGGPVREKVERSLGSGVIIATDGQIVTSNHVVKDAKEISIVLADRREFEAKVVRRDPQSDLAFLHIDTNGLPFLEVRDSDTLEVGDVVLAVGNPFGVGQTVTHGIISALARPAQGVSDYQFFIQTDAAINPGNSGGALVDTQGRLIGINTAIYSTSGGSNGIGFAIPANIVKAVQTSQVKEGRVVRPWIGLSVQPVTQEVADAMGLKSLSGALVRKALKGAPAEKAGIREGDVITVVGSNAIDDDKSLIYRTSTLAVGSSVEVTLIRKGVEKKVMFVVEGPPKSDAATHTLKDLGPLSGLVVATLTPSIAMQLGMEAQDSGGVAVLGGSGQAGAMLQKGDVITEVDQQPVADVEDLERALAGKKHGWALTVRRGEGTLTLTLRM